MVIPLLSCKGLGCPTLPHVLVHSLTPAMGHTLCPLWTAKAHKAVHMWCPWAMTAQNSGEISFTSGAVPLRSVELDNF